MPHYGVRVGHLKVWDNVQVDVSRFNEVTTTTVPAGVAGVEVDHTIFSFPHSKLVPSTQMQRSNTAILRATATFGFFMPIRFEMR
jgi:hypothetical protein